MSRVIDEGQPLSDSDRQYLMDRGQYHVIERIDYLNRDDDAGESPEESDDDGMSEAERLAGKAYEQWLVPELSAEVDRRNEELSDEDKLEKPSKKSDLIAVLREDDEALAEDDGQ